MNTDHSTNPSALPQNSWLVVCALVLAVSLFLSINFMAVQVIHVDETTQLSGASIPPVEMLRWLAGENPDRFGVPSDRTPPLFYLLHQVWTPLFGSGIVGYRFVSLVSAFTGLLFFASIVRSVSPGIWGLAVLAILLIVDELYPVQRGHPALSAFLRVGLCWLLCSDEILRGARHCT